MEDPINKNNSLSNEVNFVKLLKEKKPNLKYIEKFLNTNMLNVNQLNSQGYNILHLAIKTENSDIVYLLFQENSMENSKADPNINTKDVKSGVYLSPFEYAFQEVTDYTSLSKICKILIKNGYNLTKVNDQGYNSFHLAASYGLLDLMIYILEKDPELINSAGKKGSVIHICIIHDKVEIIQELLSFDNLNLYLLDENSNTILHKSLIDNNFNAFKLLFDYIKDSNKISIDEKKSFICAKNSKGNNLLHELALARSETMLNYVLKLDPSIAIDPSEKNNKGFTYKNVQENIVNELKEIEEAKKKERELIREIKLKMAEEERIQLEEAKKEAELLKLKEQKWQETSKIFYDNRGKILLMILLIFMVLLYYTIVYFHNKKKNKVRIIE